MALLRERFSTVALEGQIAKSMSLDHDLVRALAWLVSNRMGSAIKPIEGKRMMPAQASAQYTYALEALRNELRGYGLNDEMFLVWAYEIAAMVAVIRNSKISAHEDPTCGAVILSPHWMEPPHTEKLRATALIGSFVFFAISSETT